jgi:UDP-glucose 4-epimerase
MSDGSQIRDFISVEEVAKQFVNALDFAGTKPGMTSIRNIGTGEGQTLLAFANYWWTELGATGELRAGRVERRAGEIKRLVANIQDIHFS